MPKPVIPTSAFAAFAIMLCQRHCVFLCKGTKAKEFCKAEFLDSLPVFALARGWHSKPRKSLCDRIPLTFTTVSRCLHSLRSVDMTAFASGNSCFTNSLVQKLQNSAQAEFWDCTPVLAFETGIFFSRIQRKLNSGLGLRFLIRQGFRCQSTPGPPYAVLSLFEIGVLISEFSAS